MAVAISEDTVFHSDDVIVGFGHVKAVQAGTKVHWELPGGETTESFEEAQAVAKRLDKIIKRGCEKTGRSLLWS